MNSQFFNPGMSELVYDFAMTQLGYQQSQLLAAIYVIICYLNGNFPLSIAKLFKTKQNDSFTRID